MVTKIDIDIDDIFEDLKNEGLKAIDDMPSHLIKEDLEPVDFL